MLAAAASETSANNESGPQPNSSEKMFTISISGCESLKWSLDGQYYYTTLLGNNIDVAPRRSILLHNIKNEKRNKRRNIQGIS